jgi:hypothetical protein
MLGRGPDPWPNGRMAGSGTDKLLACGGRSGRLKYYPARPAGVAQPVERLIRNQQVAGSSPAAGSRSHPWQTG